MPDEGVKHTWKRKSTNGQVGPRRDRRRGRDFDIGKTVSSRYTGNTFISLPLAPLNVQLAKCRDRKHRDRLQSSGTIGERHQTCTILPRSSDLLFGPRSVFSTISWERSPSGLYWYHITESSFSVCFLFWPSISLMNSFKVGAGLQFCPI